MAKRTTVGPYRPSTAVIDVQRLKRNLEVFVSDGAQRLFNPVRLLCIVCRNTC